MADVEFGTSDVSAMLAEMEQEDTAGRFVSKTWSPKSEGITKIRFLPQLKSFNERIFYQKHLVHYINGVPYMCLRQTLTDENGNQHVAEDCPFCRKASQLYSSSTRGTEEWTLAGELRAKERYVARIIVRGKKDEKGNDTEYKPEFYEFGSKIRDMIRAALQSGEYGLPTDLKTGRDFNLSKRGQRKNTDYSGSMFSGSSSPVFTDATRLKALLEELPKMSYNQLVRFETKETLQNVLNEYLNGSAEDSAPVVDNNSPLSDDAIFGVAQQVVSAPAAQAAPASVDEDIDALLNQI